MVDGVVPVPRHHTSAHKEVGTGPLPTSPRTARQALAPGHAHPWPAAAKIMSCRPASPIPSMPDPDHSWSMVETYILFLWVTVILMHHGYARIVGAAVIIGCEVVMTQNLLGALGRRIEVPLRKGIEEFEPIARSRTGGITFSLVTSDSLHKVLSLAFLDRFSVAYVRVTASTSLPTARARASAPYC